MFIFWPWIGLLAVGTLIVAILSIRFAGRVTPRHRPKRNKDINYGDPEMYDADPADYPGSVVGGDGGPIQDPDCSIQFDEMTPSEVGGYPASSYGGASQSGASQSQYNPRGSAYAASSVNEHML